MGNICPADTPTLSRSPSPLREGQAKLDAQRPATLGRGCESPRCPANPPPFLDPSPQGGGCRLRHRRNKQLVPLLHRIDASQPQAYTPCRVISKPPAPVQPAPCFRGVN